MSQATEEEYRRRRFLEDVNAEYAELRKDPEAWREIEAERALWDATLLDGLPMDEVWDQESRTARKIVLSRTASESS